MTVPPPLAPPADGVGDGTTTDDADDEGVGASAALPSQLPGMSRQQVLPAAASVHSPEHDALERPTPLPYVFRGQFVQVDDPAMLNLPTGQGAAHSAFTSPSPP